MVMSAFDLLRTFEQVLRLKLVGDPKKLLDCPTHVLSKLDGEQCGRGKDQIFDSVDRLTGDADPLCQLSLGQAKTPSLLSQTV